MQKAIVEFIGTFFLVLVGPLTGGVLAVMVVQLTNPYEFETDGR
jgi:glycerol uptake facilitator-like aquaporin